MTCICVCDVCVGVIFTHFSTSFNKCCKHARIELFMLSCHKFIWSSGPHIDGACGAMGKEGSVGAGSAGAGSAGCEVCCQTDVRALER